MQSQAKIIKEKIIAKKDFILYFDNTHIYATRQYAFILAKGIASHCVFTIKFSSTKYMCTRSVVQKYFVLKKNRMKTEANKWL